MKRVCAFARSGLRLENVIWAARKSHVNNLNLFYGYYHLYYLRYQYSQYFAADFIMSQKHISKLQLFVYRCISMMLGLLTRTSDYIVFPVLSTIRSALWKSSLPPIDDRILLMSATELAEKIRTQQVTQMHFPCLLH